MYEIFKIENGKLRKYDYYIPKKRFFNKSKRRLSKLIKDLNSRENNIKYILLKIG